jgi:putative restriction endonuclease
VAVLPCEIRNADAPAASFCDGSGILMTASFLKQINKVATWRRGGQRAPHKPLLLLLALSEWARGRRSLGFVEFADRLANLLVEFGPPRRVVHPEYPFWRLQRDGVWTVKFEGKLHKRRSNSDPTRSSLMACQATGAFSESVVAELSAHPDRVWQAADILLANHFPATLHDDLRSELGITREERSARRAGRRDPRFRAAVLQAYGYRCAICGYGLRLVHSPVGLEAAHIRWHQCGGPDEITNGVAMCALHHKLFDLGAFTLSPRLRVLVSDAVSGAGDLTAYLLRFHNNAIAQSVHSEDSPAVEHVSWHRQEVFKGRPRPRQLD